MKLLTLVTVFLLGAMLLAAADDKTPITDDHLYDQVRVRLAGDRDTGGERIEVAVKDGIVELKGNVRSERVREKAEKIAKKVKGVKKVDNLLKISVM
jgi:hyperosmotically inducible protein